ncbi:MAG TPA: hypothetical protein PLC42_03930, partial [Parachlamydiaceae bacterium]|nr:hypothetical protein [Parachlamydiaceae bacterium]
MHLISRDSLPSFASLKLQVIQFKDKIAPIVRPYLQQLGNISKEEIIRSIYEIRLTDKPVIAAAFLGGILIVKKISILLAKIRKLSDEIQKKTEELTNKDKEQEALKKEIQDLEEKKLKTEESAKNIAKLETQIEEKKKENIQLNNDEVGKKKTEELINKGEEQEALKKNIQDLKEDIQLNNDKLGKKKAESAKPQNQIQKKEPETSEKPQKAVNQGKSNLNQTSTQELTISSFQNLSDPLAKSSIKETSNNNQANNNQGFFGGFYRVTGNLITGAKDAQKYAIGTGLACVRSYGANYAYESFTTNAPKYKLNQVSHTLINLALELSKVVNYKLSSTETFNHFEPLNFQKACIEYLGQKNKQNSRNMIELIKLLNFEFSISTNKVPEIKMLENAGEIRYLFLTKLEEVVKDINYDEEIENYLKTEQKDRSIKYPHIHLLHVIATHIIEAPIWNQATNRLNGILNYKDVTGTESISQVLQSNTAVMKKLEAEEFKKGVTWERKGVTFEKARMQVPGGKQEATNNRSNFSSLLGTFTTNGNKPQKWLAMGTPTMDGGAQNEKAQLWAPYVLYIDSLIAKKESLSFFGLQKCSAESISNDFDNEEYEKNRTESLKNASWQIGRWKNFFSFVNLSLDQVTEDENLKLIDVAKLQKNETSDELVSIANFKKDLEELMVSNKAGFSGLKKEDVEKAFSIVIKKFFPPANYKTLNNKQRWVFLMLTYAVIILNSKHHFHFGCKDNIDRGMVVAVAVKLVSQFNRLADKNLTQKDRKKILNELSTLLAHRADLVKGQAVIDSRAPLAYFVADHIEELIKSGVSTNQSDNQLENLTSFEF